MAQTVQNVDPSKGQIGQVASSADKQIDSAQAEAAVPVGRFVVRGTDELKVTLPAAAASLTDLEGRGFAVLDSTRISADYAADDFMSFLEKGEIYADCEEAVTAGNAVFVRYSVGGTVGGNLGAVRTDDDNDGAAHAAALPNAVFAETTTAAGPAKVKFYR